MAAEDGESEEVYWKENLYFWRGALTLESKRPSKTRRKGNGRQANAVSSAARSSIPILRCQWTGTWVQTVGRKLPSAEEFHESPNQFSLMGEIVSGDNSEQIENLLTTVTTGEEQVPASRLEGLKVQWKGYYLMDGEKYKDISHTACFIKLPEVCGCVFLASLW